jgi:hypothetical protein
MRKQSYSRGVAAFLLPQAVRPGNPASLELLQFYLYGKATRQFGAFHICLERTHRYLLAYKMAEQMNSGKDDALQKIVCIMANAPIITRQDIDGESSGMKTPKTAPTSIVTASLGMP